MIGLLTIAFVMGAVGGLHCIGMCGPIAISLPLITNSPSSRALSALLYNIGRTVTYIFIGFILGLVGNLFTLFGLQQWLSILVGAAILLYLVFPKTKLHKPSLAPGFLKLLRNKITTLFTQKKHLSVFYIGLLNGLLPCGLVYLAVAGAVATATAFKAALFMAAFGLGTLPMMWGIAFFGGAIGLQFRYRIKKWYPYMMALMAVLLIIRGLGLHIPYLSPAVGAGGRPSFIECYK